MLSQVSEAQDGARQFIRRAMKAPLLAPDRELELARRWRDEGDEDALHELTTAYMRLVISMAGRFRRYGLSMGDLVQEGNVGLMQAAARFEPERAVRFSTYAAWWIRSAIQDFVLRNWSIVRTGTTAAQKSLFFNLRRLRARLDDMGEAGVSPENRTRIAVELGVEERDVETMSARLSAADRSLNAPLAESGEAEWQDILPDLGDTPDDMVMHRHDAGVRGRWIEAALSTLSARELFIITERRLTEEGATLESLGRRLGVSKERVRQIEHAALGKLRAALVKAVGDPVEAGLIDG